jgi:hypothetical protein
MKIARQIKGDERVKIERGDVIGIKVDRFKKAVQEAKEATLIKQLEEERNIRKRELEAYQREQQMKLLQDRRKMLEAELGLYQPINDHTELTLAEPERIEHKDKPETQLSESNEDIRLPSVIRRNYLYSSIACYLR